jgi:hypothetical protein
MIEEETPIIDKTETDKPPFRLVFIDRTPCEECDWLLIFGLMTLACSLGYFFGVRYGSKQ